MLSAMTSPRQAMSWTWTGDSDPVQEPRWLQELQSQESLRQIDRATKYVHIRRGSKTWSTVLQQIQDSYKLNYVEVEIGPPKPGRDGAERGPFMKLSGSGSDVNYSTIIFPDRDKKSEGSENRNSVGNGTSKAHQKLERKNSKKSKQAKQLQKQQKLLQQHQQQQRQAEQELLQQFYSEPPVLDPRSQQDENPLGDGPAPTSQTARPRALSTPTSNRKFPTEAELTDAIKAHQERRDQDPPSPPSTLTSPPKTRTLPSREKPWFEDEMQAQEPIIMSKKDPSLPHGTKPIELSNALRVIQKKNVRRKSSAEGYPFDFTHQPEHPTNLSKSSSFGPQDLSLSEPCAEILVEDSKQSKPPVLKKSKSELEKAFEKARRKKGKGDGESKHVQSSADNSPSGSEASSPRDLAEPKSAKEKLRFNFPSFFKSKSRGAPDGQCVKSSSSPVVVASSPESKSPLPVLDLDKKYCSSMSGPGRKPVPLPRNQERKSSIESITEFPNSPKYNERPIPSPPNQPPLQQSQQQQTQSSHHAWVDSPSFHQTEDEMYMNVAFSKPNKLPVSPSHQQPAIMTQVQHSSPPLPGHPSPGHSGSTSPGMEQVPLHRYENVFLEERVERLSGPQDRPSSTDSSLRGSIEMNRPVPAPRYYGSHVDVSMTTSSSHGSSHPGHIRKESWGNAATFASHGISPSSHHRMSPKHDSPSGSSRMKEFNAHLKNSIASLTTSHNSHIGQTGRAMSTEGVNLKPKSPPAHVTRSSGSMDINSGSASNRGSSSGADVPRHNRGPRGSNASLGPGSGSVDGSSMNMLRKMSQDRILPSFATAPWYYGKMLRQECEYLMLSQGKSCQYLVRDSSHRVGDLMLSVLYGTKVHHYVIQTTAEGKFQIAHHDFNSVEDILDFYHHHVIMYSPNQEPVYLRDPFLLTH